jgi:hypothetical protein
LKRPKTKSARPMLKAAASSRCALGNLLGYTSEIGPTRMLFLIELAKTCSKTGGYSAFLNISYQAGGLVYVFQHH